MTFPEDWPEGCPPADSSIANAIVIRIVQNNPPTIRDFSSFVELGRQLNSPVDCPCMPLGLSMFLSRDDAIWMSRKYPRLGRYLAMGQPSIADGTVKLTKGQRPTHTTWWPSNECERLGVFGNCEEIQ